MNQKLIQAFPALSKNDIRSRNEDYVFRVDIVKCNSYNITFISFQFNYGIWETGYAQVVLLPHALLMQTRTLLGFRKDTVAGK